MTEKKKNAPPPAKAFKLKDYQEMRRFSQDMGDAINRAKQDRLTPEEWDEALNELKKNGTLSDKYKNRLGIEKKTVRPGRPVIDDAGNPVKNDDGTTKFEPDMTQPPEVKIRYYDVAVRNFTRQALKLGKKYEKILSQVIATEAPGEKKNAVQALALVRKLLSTPEAKQMLRKLEKTGRLATMDSIPSNDVILWILRVTGIKDENQIPEENPHTNETISPPTEYNNTLTYRRTTKNSRLEVKIRHPSEFLKHREKFQSLFLFVLRKMNKQGYPDRVRISLDEMVELGMYQSTKAAKKALLDFVESQRDIGIAGKTKKGRRHVTSTKNGIAIPETTPAEMGGVMFGNYYCIDNYVMFDVNVNLNTDFLATYFSCFHKKGHELKGNALLLYFYISALARQNARKIKDTGVFYVSINSVRINLNLPSVEDVRKDYNRNYKKEIIEPIENAIAEVEKTISFTPEARDLGFTITAITDYYDTGHYMDYLEGTLEIGMKGEYAKTFIKIAEKAERKQRSFERAVEKATAKAIAEKRLKAPKE